MMPGQTEPRLTKAGPATLTARERTRLAGILARLSSPFENERAAAGLLASAFMDRHGIGWSDLIDVLGSRPGVDAAPAPEPVRGERVRATPVRSEPVRVAQARPERRRNGTGGWRGYDRRRNAQPGRELNLSL
jgi:hypothetical protein